MRIWKPISPGDKVALLSPSSTPDSGWVQTCMETIAGWGLEPVPGAHILDTHGFMAGRDEDRLADLNAAIRDPGIRAIITTRGGAGAYRIATAVDTRALGADPKPLVGFSDVTALHLAWQFGAGLQSIHGSTADRTGEGVRRMLLAPTTTRTIQVDASAIGVECTTGGCATGPLYGGNLEILARTVGTRSMSFAGGIFFFEAPKTVGLGMVDRQLTQLMLSGVLDGIAGVAVGGLEGFEDYTDRGWSIIDVVTDRLHPLGVPVLGGVPAGHRLGAEPLILGAPTRIDADRGTLTQFPSDSHFS
ncbi:MAG TPA: LD-carboxypeptidase [Thermomicrobiales bacterium]|nr:LD-carboxypeptidase [Thermomicrobiales bacterium]